MEKYHPSIALPIQRGNKETRQQTTDVIAEEVPIALIYNGISHAVMLATPADLEDFAIGFSLTEGIVPSIHDIYGIDIEEAFNGIRIEIEIASAQFNHLKERRRNLAGRTGCGLCGTDSLAQAVKILPKLTSTATFSIPTILNGFSKMQAKQYLKQQTGATHAAAWLDRSGTLIDIREDVGRHNALDKLIGTLSRHHIDKTQGIVLVTSRASYEMVQKCVLAKIPALAAISAPTALAIRMAQQAGLLLLGFVRQDNYTIYADTHQRIG